MRRSSPKSSTEATPKLAVRPKARSLPAIGDGKKRKRLQAEPVSATKAGGQQASDGGTSRGTKRARLGTAGVTPSRPRNSMARVSWLDLPLAELSWGCTEHLKCRKVGGDWVVHAAAPQLPRKLRLRGAAAQRWLRTAAASGAVTQVGAIERQIGAAAGVGREDFEGGLPFLPRTVRARLNLVASRQPRQPRGSQARARGIAKRTAPPSFTAPPVAHKRPTETEVHTVFNRASISAMPAAPAALRCG